MQKCDFNFIEVTLLHWVFLCKYATYLHANAIFREHFWWTASVYRSKYRRYKYRGSLQAGKKLIEIHFNIINTFSNFIRDFCLEAKD